MDTPTVVKVTVEAMRLQMYHAVQQRFSEQLIKQAIDAELTPERLLEETRHAVQHEMKGFIQTIVAQVINRNERLQDYVRDTAQREVNRQVEEMAELRKKYDGGK